MQLVAGAEAGHGPVHVRGRRGAGDLAHQLQPVPALGRLLEGDGDGVLAAAAGDDVDPHLLAPLPRTEHAHQPAAAHPPQQEPQPRVKLIAVRSQTQTDINAPEPPPWKDP